MTTNKNQGSGRYVETIAFGEKVSAFLPNPLPTEFDITSPKIFGRLNDANRALGRLDGIKDMLPNADLFLYFYVRKEALLSSQIEGTQSSFSDLLLFEADEKPNVSIDDVGEVTNYVAAMNLGLERLQSLPLSSRLLKELHAVLMRGVRGETKNPGEFRRSQNWIGGTRPGNARFVPPPPDKVTELMSDLEKFIHADELKEAPLIKAALVHVQFETIHPFLDGNGRLGRLLIALMLVESEALSAPLLYLSLYLKARRDDYYALLSKVRFENGWEDWLEFFLDGVIETSAQAVRTAQRLLAQFDEDEQKIRSLGRTSDSALRVYTELKRRPIANVPRLAEWSGLTAPTVRSSLKRLVDIGVVIQPGNEKRDKVYIYRSILQILEQGTDPL
jgi:Fic family protein